MAYEHRCDFCGRPLFRQIRSHGHTFCDKHYRQFKRYGRVLDTNPRTVMDRNEVHIQGDAAYIDLYDKDLQVIAQAVVDTEDLEKVRYTKWHLSASGYVMNTPKFAGSNKYLSRVILGTDQFVDHIDHDPLNNRKSNLRIVTKSQNQMNVNYQGVRQTQNGKWYAYIRLDGRMYNLGVYVDREEALFARWYAETVLFGEYRCPKEKPVILPDRERDIMAYVDRKVQRV